MYKNILILFVFIFDVKEHVCEEIFFSESEILNVLKMSNILSDSNFSTFAFLFDSQECDSLNSRFYFNSNWKSTSPLKAMKIIYLQ